MKFIDYLFYNIYSWYNKKGTFRKSNDPSMRASFLLGICLGGWCLFVAYLYYSYTNGGHFSVYLQYVIVLITLVSSGFFHLHYSSTIYWSIDKKYSEENQPYRFIKNPVFFSLSFIFLPFILSSIFFMIH